MFKFMLSIICVLFSCFSSVQIRFDPKQGSLNHNQNTALIEDVVPMEKRAALSESALFIDDYYSNHYFYNSIENYGRNAKGSCTQLALAQLLTFIDTYWDDSFVPDNYEQASDLEKNEFDYSSNAPGIYREPEEVEGLPTYDYYWNVVDKLCGTYFHLLIIKLGYEQFGYYDFSDPSNPCALSDGQINKIANYYLYTYLGKTKSNVSIDYSDKSSNSNRRFVIKNVKAGIPVLARVRLTAGGHAMVAYDYDEDEDELYFHAGWESDSRHYSET